MFGEIDEKKKFPRKQWRDVLNIVNGKDCKSVIDKNGAFPIYGTGGIMGHSSKFLCPENTIVMGRKGTIDKPFVVAEPFWIVDTAFGIVPNHEFLHYMYLYWYCKQLDYSKLNKASTLPSTTKEDLYNLSINIPPMEQQEQFAAFVRQSDKSKLLLASMLGFL